MDPSEIIKHAPDLLKGGAALAGALKFTDIVKAMLGPATAEVAERFRDQVRLYRFGRQLECLTKAEKMATDAGFTPKAVPIKILFPLLEGASLEENEDLHTMWAALLANAALPTKGELVRPGFIAILKNLSHDEGMMLKWMLEQLPATAWCIRMSYSLIDEAYSKLFGAAMALPGHRVSMADPRCRICVSGLAASGLIRIAMDMPDGQDGYLLTYYGYEFITACQPPQAP